MKRTFIRAIALLTLFSSVLPAFGMNFVKKSNFSASKNKITPNNTLRAQNTFKNNKIKTPKLNKFLQKNSKRTYHNFNNSNQSFCKWAFWSSFRNTKKFFVSGKNRAQSLLSFFVPFLGSSDSDDDDDEDSDDEDITKTQEKSDYQFDHIQGEYKIEQLNDFSEKELNEFVNKLITEIVTIDDNAHLYPNKHSDIILKYHVAKQLLDDSQKLLNHLEKTSSLLYHSLVSTNNFEHRGVVIKNLTKQNFQLLLNDINGHGLKTICIITRFNAHSKQLSNLGLEDFFTKDRIKKLLENEFGQHILSESSKYINIERIIPSIKAYIPELIDNKSYYLLAFASTFDISISLAIEKQLNEKNLNEFAHFAHCLFSNQNKEFFDTFLDKFSCKSNNLINLIIETLKNKEIITNYYHIRYIINTFARTINLDPKTKNNFISQLKRNKNMDVIINNVKSLEEDNKEECFSILQLIAPLISQEDIDFKKKFDIMTTAYVGGNGCDEKTETNLKKLLKNNDVPDVKTLALIASYVKNCKNKQTDTWNEKYKGLTFSYLRENPDKAIKTYNSDIRNDKYMEQIINNYVKEELEYQKNGYDTFVHGSPNNVVSQMIFSFLHNIKNNTSNTDKCILPFIREVPKNTNDESIMRQKLILNGSNSKQHEKYGKYSLFTNYTPFANSWWHLERSTHFVKENISHKGSKINPKYVFNIHNLEWMYDEFRQEIDSLESEMKKIVDNHGVFLIIASPKEKTNNYVFYSLPNGWIYNPKNRNEKVFFRLKNKNNNIVETRDVRKILDVIQNHPENAVSASDKTIFVLAATFDKEGPLHPDSNVIIKHVTGGTDVQIRKFNEQKEELFVKIKNRYDEYQKEKDRD